jgi:thiamine biosynthesis protein ThiS
VYAALCISRRLILYASCACPIPGGIKMLLNDRQYEFFEEGITIKSVIEKMNYIYPKLVVRVNDVLIEKEDYEKTVLSENDDVKIYHLLAGG